MLNIAGILAVFLGYLLGSIPSVYLVGRLKDIDLREDVDGSLGTALAFQRLGTASGLVVGLMDLGKGIMSIAVAQKLNVPLVFVLLAGLAAVLGHDWSIFLGFKGGRGAVTSYGVLVSLVPLEFLVALALAGAVYFFTHRTTLATVILLGILPAIVWVQSSYQVLPILAWGRDFSPLLMAFPLSLYIPLYLKYVQRP